MATQGSSAHGPPLACGRIEARNRRSSSTASISWDVEPSSQRRTTFAAMPSAWCAQRAPGSLEPRGARQGGLRLHGQALILPCMQPSMRVVKTVRLGPIACRGSRACLHGQRLRVAHTLEYLDPVHPAAQKLWGHLTCQAPPQAIADGGCALDIDVQVELQHVLQGAQQTRREAVGVHLGVHLVHIMRHDCTVSPQRRAVCAVVCPDEFFRVVCVRCEE
eukprot:scaffold16761_cov142-Isochrysis_galbana.AAC.6